MVSVIDDNVRVGRRKQKYYETPTEVDRDQAEITLSDRLFQLVGPVTVKDRAPTADSLAPADHRHQTPAPVRCCPLVCHYEYLQQCHIHAAHC